MLIFDLYILSAAIAMIAWTYTTILVDTEMILEPWKRWLYLKTGDKYAWFFKMIVGCGYCVGGQMALWTFVYLATVGSFLFDLKDLNVVELIVSGIFLVSSAVFNVALINKTRIYE